MSVQSTDLRTHVLLSGEKYYNFDWEEYIPTNMWSLIAKIALFSKLLRRQEP